MSELSTVESTSEEAEASAIDCWRSIVEAAWALNYISVGLQDIMPRLISAKEFLDELETRAQALENQTAIDVVERELRTMADEFRKVSEELNARTGEIEKILSLLAARRS
jgi:hypothetical protein